MSKETKSIGRLGESYSRGYLTRIGYTLLHTPFRCKFGEIDIIARENDILVFIEVKTRRSLKQGSGLEAITYQKQQRIIRTARFFLAKFAPKIAYRFCRFDVIEIRQDLNASNPEIIHIKDAFRADG